MAATTSLVGFLAGTLSASFDLAGRQWVREFQAGAPSSLGEKVFAAAQRASIDGLGFLFLGVALGALALLAGRVLWPREGTVRRASGGIILAAAAYLFWIGFGTWLAGEALPYLTPGGIALLDLAGLAAGCIALMVLALGLRVVFRKTMASPIGSAAGASGAGALAWLGLGLMTSHVDARTVVWAVLSTAVVLAIVIWDVNRGEGRFVITRRIAAGSLLACALVTLPGFRLGAAPVDLAYAQLPQPEGPPGPNVVFVTIDTLRADHLGSYGYDRPTSPFLDEIAAGGARFADATAAAAWTKPATGTILTGLYPSRHGALYHGSRLQLPDGEQTMAEAFQRSGAVTAGFVSNPNVKRIFDFDRGFDEFFDSPVDDTVALASVRGSIFGRMVMELTRHQFNWKYENDVLQMNRYALAWLSENRSRRFFLYLHYIDPHIPYAPPDSYAESFRGDHPGFPLFNERKRLVGMDLYDAEIRYTDDGIAALVEGLIDMDLWDNTLFVVTSDHGEEFFEHEVLGHGFSLYQGVLGVPLVMHGPGVPAGIVVEDPVQVLDLPATVLELAGTGITRLGDGKSFAGHFRSGGGAETVPYYLENEFGTDARDDRSFVLNGVREGRWKLVLTERNVYRPPSDPRYAGEELYDVLLDPEERTNLVGSAEHRAVFERLTEDLRRHAKFLSETGFRTVAPAALSPELEEQLRALGYAGR